MDPEASITTCPKYKPTEVVDTMRLDEKFWLYCKESMFGDVRKFDVIS